MHSLSTPQYVFYILHGSQKLYWLYNQSWGLNIALAERCQCLKEATVRRLELYQANPGLMPLLSVTRQAFSLMDNG